MLQLAPGLGICSFAFRSRHTEKERWERFAPVALYFKEWRGILLPLTKEWRDSLFMLRKCDLLFLRVICFKFFLFPWFSSFYAQNKRVNCCKRRHLLLSLIKKERGERFALVDLFKRVKRGKNTFALKKRAIHTKNQKANFQPWLAHIKHWNFLVSCMKKIIFYEQELCYFWHLGQQQFAWKNMTNCNSL